MADLPSGTVTLLFIDMEGSTRLQQQLGERYAGVLAKCQQVLRSAIGQWHGQEVDTQSDAFFVVFARASDAASAAVAIQRALASHAWPQDAAVRVRVGMHTGEPQLFAEGYVGVDVNYAALIMSAGHGGQILLSQTTGALVEPILPKGVHLQDLGEHRLKDLRRPSRLFQLSITDLPSDFPPLKTLDSYPNNLPMQPTPFVGREQEVTRVCALLCRPEVWLVTLTGPGGIGKTRLGLQVAAELADSFADGVFLVSLALAEEAEPQLQGTEQARWLARLELEHENLRATLSFLLELARVKVGTQEEPSQAEWALRLCTALYGFWNTCGYSREGQAFLEQALVLRSDVGAAVRARALNTAADLAFALDDME